MDLFWSIWVYFIDWICYNGTSTGPLGKITGREFGETVKSCFFIGHRDASEEVLPALLEAVEQHIVEYGVTEFIVGNYGGFDHLAAKAVIAAKKRHPNVTLSMLIPYHPAERPVEVPQGFDNTFYPPGQEKVPRRFAIVRANRYMADHVDYLIAYVWHPASNAHELLEYVQRKGIHTTNLGACKLRLLSRG